MIKNATIKRMVVDYNKSKCPELRDKIIKHINLNIDNQMARIKELHSLLLKIK